jgi:hypothetical protein
MTAHRRSVGVYQWRWLRYAWPARVDSKGRLAARRCGRDVRLARGRPVTIDVAAFIIFNSGVVLGVLVCRLTEWFKPGRHHR